MATNGRIAVMCPTRDRPGEFRKMAGSVMGTSSKADVIFYADDDQYELYHHMTKADGLRGRIREFFGPRVGPVSSANVLAIKFPEYAAYGMITDDSQITTPGWDGWLLETVKQFPNEVAVVSPHHNQGSFVDMPFVTKNWMTAVGWFACPRMRHYCWPILTGLIGEMSAICHAPRQSFNIDHDYEPDANHDVRKEDATAFFDYVSFKLQSRVESVRAALAM